MNWEVKTVSTKTSFFNWTIYKKAVTRFWPLWGMYFMGWFFSMPYLLIQVMSFTDARQISTELVHYISMLSFTPSVVTAFLYAIPVSMAVFSYAYTSKSLSLYHALPVKREALFTSSYLAGITYTVLPAVVIFALTAAVTARYINFTIGPLLIWLGVNVLLSIIFLSIAAICAQMTGSVLMLPVLYLIFNFVFVAVEALLRYLSTLLMFGYTAPNEILTDFTSPVIFFNRAGRLFYYPEGGYRYQQVFAGWKWLLIYAAAGIILTAVAMMLYKHKKSESATDMIAFSGLKPVFKYCMGLGFAISLGVALFLITNHRGAQGSWRLALILGICMTFAALIGLIIAEMGLQRSFRVFKPRLFISLLICAVVIFAGIFLLQNDVFGIEKKIPDPSSVESVDVRFSSSGAWANYNGITSEDQIRQIAGLHQLVLDNKAEIQKNQRPEVFYTSADAAASDAPRFVQDMYMTVTYHLKNGRTVEREYNQIPITDIDLKDPKTIASRVTEFNRQKEMILNRIEPQQENATLDHVWIPGADDISLSQAQMKMIENAIHEDAENGRLPAFTLFETDEYLAEVYESQINLEYKSGDNNRPYYTDVNIAFGRNSSSTLRALQEAGLDTSKLLTLKESYENYHREYMGEDVVVYS